MAKNSNIFGVQQLATDAICCALIVSFSLFFSSLAYFSRSVFGVLIMAIFAFHFSKKSLVRCLTAGTASALLMIMLQGATLAIAVSIPNVLGGIALSLVLQKNDKLYYPIAAPVLTAISVGEYLLASYLMMGRPIFDTLQDSLIKYDFIQIPEANISFYLTCYLICFCFAMALMKSIIVKKFCRLLRRYLLKTSD